MAKNKVYLQDVELFGQINRVVESKRELLYALGGIDPKTIVNPGTVDPKTLSRDEREQYKQDVVLWSQKVAIDKHVEEKRVEGMNKVEKAGKGLNAEERQKLLKPMMDALIKNTHDLTKEAAAFEKGRNEDMRREAKGLAKADGYRKRAEALIARLETPDVGEINRLADEVEAASEKMLKTRFIEPKAERSAVASAENKKGAPAPKAKPGHPSVATNP